MRLTDDDLKKIFPYGASLVDERDEDAIPLRGLVEPHDENPEWMNLWVTEGANSVLVRDVEDLGGRYRIDHWGRPHILIALPEDRRVVF